MPDASLPIAPVPARDPKKKEEKDVKLDEKDKKDASKGKEGESEELVRVQTIFRSLLADMSRIVGRGPPTSQ